MNDSPYLTYKQAAQYLSVPIGTLYGWGHEGASPTSGSQAGRSASSAPTSMLGREPDA